MDFDSITPKEKLCAQFVGKSLHEIPTPAAIIDVAIARKTCDEMVRVAHKLGFEFRPDVGCHKTTELTLLQMGRDIGNIPEKTLAVSTIAELEGLLPLFKASERDQPIADLITGQILYGVPLRVSEVPRLVALYKELGISIFNVIVDNKQQLLSLHEFTAAGLPWPKLFIGIDMGERWRYSGGVGARSDELKDLVNYIISVEEKQPEALFRGFYCRTVQDPRSDDKAETEALKLLHKEIFYVAEAAKFTRDVISKPKRSFILSVGNTPAANHIRTTFGGGNPALTSSGGNPALTSDLVLIHGIHGILNTAKGEGLRVELHADAYPFLDVRQIWACARALGDDGKDKNTAIFSSIALTTLTEVTSVRPDGRSAIIAANPTILGFPDQYWECYGYLSWWNMPGRKGVASPDGNRWQVNHLAGGDGVLEQYDVDDAEKLVVGQRVRIVPNQVSAVGQGLGRYFIVDSDRKGKEDEVIDVWVRWKDY
ncbi:hypothetical protein GP486_001475 [Trichoglossum hirsutum]|uniref:D-serine dehydratase-like domain-containing protein n=1 Tax=Trichoglossum hirsutum TaxID=265104 RepID=A0A9P8LGR4_9PEZI|nr:hypothetical protein GP486_001475 [Trichoglossum hirsutum]